MNEKMLITGLPAGTKAALDQIAASRNVSVSELVRQFIAAEIAVAPVAAPTTGRRVRGLRRHTNGRQPGKFVVIDRWSDTGGSRLELRIGKALWRACGCPPRFDIQKNGRGFVLLAVYAGDAGYSVSGGEKNMPRMRCKTADDLLPADGRYENVVVAGGTKIVVEVE